jgi:hypothetical protein
LHAKSYLGKTKLYNYSKVKDPKNPPVIEALTLIQSSATATKPSAPELNRNPNLLMKHENEGREIAQSLCSNTTLAAI